MKAGKTVLLIFWIVLAIIIIAALIGGMLFSVRTERIIRSSSSTTVWEDSNMTVYLDNTISMDGISFIEVSPPAADVTIRHAEDDQFRVVQRGYNVDDRFLAVVSNSDTEIRVRPPSGVRLFDFWGANGFRDNYVDIYIPSGYAGDLTIRLSAGGLKIPDSFSLQEASIHVSAGKLSADGALTAQSAELTVSAGGLEMASLQADRFKLRTSAGSLKITGLTGAGEIRSSAGGITVSKLEMTGDLDIRSSAGSIKVGLTGDPSLDFSAKSSAGSIKTYFGANSSGANGRISQTIGEAPYKKLEISSSAGSIRIDRAD